MYLKDRTSSYGVAYVESIAAGMLLLACSSADRKDTEQRSNGQMAVESTQSSGGTVYGMDTDRTPVRAKRVGVAADAVNWDAEKVADHLTGFGLTVDAVGVVARPMFRVRGQSFRVEGGRAVVEAYFYGDASAVALDNDQLDTIQVMPKGGTMGWDMPARLIVDNNLAAVVLTADPALRKKIEISLRSDLRGRRRAR